MIAPRDKPAFVDEMAFSKPWRPYQERVFKMLPEHFEDHNLHLVSAPGSGKTVVGLEVLRRIGAPTLVFAPTIAIREQWIDRLKSDFLEDEKPDWLSRDLRNPGDLTISTYQSLSSEFRKDGGFEAVVSALTGAGVATLVVDEAHHLRANWWKCLTTVKESLDHVSVIALTATPPIDVPAAEWSRYASFCGAVDVEVGVPELVAAGNLCPHQDFVLFSIPSGEDVAELQRFYRGVTRFMLDLQINIELAENLGIHSPFSWIEESDDADFRKDHQTFFIALSIFLQQTGGYIPPEIREAFSIEGEELPPELTIEWAEVLLQGILFTFRERIEITPGIAPKLLTSLVDLEDHLRDLGAIEKSRVVLRGNEENEKLLRDSSSKLESIGQIIDHELDAQGVLMRAVILTDYIRQESFPSPGEIDPPLTKLGVVPIFEMLRRFRIKHLFPGALTGSLVIVPRETKDKLAELAEQNGIERDGLRMKPLPHDPDFLQVEVADNDRQRVVATVTELFQLGEINCLIGTAALLGEGWDAPAINTLILASVIGSFVMSNQMRGRAIRSHPGIEGKTANIWHVATVPPEFNSLDKKTDYDPGNDFAKLLRRFDAFHGVAFSMDGKGEALVENGWQRLGLGSTISPDEVKNHNRRMFRESGRRENIQFVWRRAIAPASEGRFLRPVRELRTPRKLAASKFILRVAGTEDKGLRHTLAGWMERRRLHRIAFAIGRSLHDNGLIETEFSSRELRVEVTPTRFQVSAPLLNPAEQVHLITAIDEFFDVFNNPRYIIQQKNRFYGVPRKLGEKKSLAISFSARLKSAGFGRHTLIYTQSKAGKTILLEARKQRLLKQFDFTTDTRISWQAEDPESDGNTNE